MKPLLLPKKVALVYDRINTPHGGAELVMQELHNLFPNAPIFTSVYHKRAHWASSFKIYPSFLQKIPFFNNKHQLLLPLMPLAFESLDLTEYECVISVSSAEAKGVLTSPDQLHICYLLTPPRYLDKNNQNYLSAHWVYNTPGFAQITKLLLRYIDWWDKAAAFRPDVIIPISNLVSQRIKKSYNRIPDLLIYPPIPTPSNSEELLKTKSYLKKSYLLQISRLVPYKGVEIAIEAAQKLNMPLIIAGEGSHLKKLALIFPEITAIRNLNESLETFFDRATKQKSLILFCRSVSHQEKEKLLIHAHTGLMLGLEDFGITGLEYLAYGCPVVYFSQSGASEILSKESAAFPINNQTREDVIKALNQRIKKIKKRTHFHNFTVHYTKHSFSATMKDRLSRHWYKHIHSV